MEGACVVCPRPGLSAGKCATSFYYQKLIYQDIK